MQLNVSDWAKNGIVLLRLNQAALHHRNSTVVIWLNVDCFLLFLLEIDRSYFYIHPVDTGHKIKVNDVFGRPGRYMSYICSILTLLAPTPQNGQTASKMFSTKADTDWLSVSNNFVGLELNPIQNGRFWGCWWMGWGAKKAPLPKICHTYPTVMKPRTVLPYVKNIQKIYEPRDTPCHFCWHQHFFTGNQQIVFSRNRDINCILVHRF